MYIFKKQSGNLSKEKKGSSFKAAITPTGYFEHIVKTEEVSSNLIKTFPLSPRYQGFHLLWSCVTQTTAY